MFRAKVFVLGGTEFVQEKDQVLEDVVIRDRSGWRKFRGNFSSVVFKGIVK